VQEIFKFRDWAVHPGNRFRNPGYRDDVDVGVDWHFVAFRASNSVAAVGKIVELIDFFVAVLDRGSKELVEWKPHARRAMDQILDAYEASDKLRPIGRVEPEATNAEADGAQQPQLAVRTRYLPNVSNKRSTCGDTLTRGIGGAGDGNRTRVASLED
jgi:hypothetical protein